MAKTGDFSKDIDGFITGFVSGSEKTIRVVTAKTWSAIIKDSPVDEGRFRGNWFASGKLESNRQAETLDKSNNGVDTANKAAKVALSLKDWSVFTLTNNLPYANVIEYGGYGNGPLTQGGYSKQAPQGVVRVNISRTTALIEAEAKKNLPK